MNFDPQNKVPFPQAGEGACLRFTTRDYVSLRNKYGEPKLVKQTVKDPSGFPVEIEVWETFSQRIDQALVLFEPDVILECLRVGLKKADGRDPWNEIDYNDLPFGLVVAVPPIQDALVLALTNQPYTLLVAKRRAEDAEKARLRARGVEFNDEESADAGADPQQTLTNSASSAEPLGSDTPPAS